MIAAIPSLLLALRGEPEADKAYVTLRAEIESQKAVIKELHNSLSHIEGFQEGYQAGALKEQLEALQKQYDALKATKSRKSPVLDQIRERRVSRLLEKLERDKATDRRKKRERKLEQLKRLPPKLEDVQPQVQQQAP